MWKQENQEFKFGLYYIVILCFLKTKKVKTNKQKMGAGDLAESAHVGLPSVNEALNSRPSSI